MGLGRNYSWIEFRNKTVHSKTIVSWRCSKQVLSLLLAVWVALSSFQKYSLCTSGYYNLRYKPIYMIKGNSVNSKSPNPVILFRHRVHDHNMYRLMSNLEVRFNSCKYPVISAQDSFNSHFVFIMWPVWYVKMCIVFWMTFGFLCAARTISLYSTVCYLSTHC